MIDDDLYLINLSKFNFPSIFIGGDSFRFIITLSNKRVFFSVLYSPWNSKFVKLKFSIIELYLWLNNESISLKLSCLIWKDIFLIESFIYMKFAPTIESL